MVEIPEKHDHLEDAEYLERMSGKKVASRFWTSEISICWQEFGSNVEKVHRTRKKSLLHSIILCRCTAYLPLQSQINFML